MRVSINQPAYLPWLGYFDRIARSDLHVVLDTVQIELKTKTAFTNRNKIRTANGWTWVTVPVSKTQDSHPLISDARIDNSRNWARKHRMTISQSYAKAVHFKEHAGFVEELYGTEWDRLVDLLRFGTGYLVDALGVTTSLVPNSELGVQGEKGDLVLAICQEVGATEYLSGPFGRTYLDLDRFADAGVEVVFHEYEHPEYEQAYPGFEPYMSVIDLLFCHGPRSLEILKGRDA